MSQQQQQRQSGEEVEPQQQDVEPEHQEALQEARRILYDMSAGRWGTDEDGIYETLEELDQEVRDLISEDPEIMRWLREDMSSSELERVNDILGTDLEPEVLEFRESLQEAATMEGVAGAVGGFLENLAPEDGNCFNGSVQVRFGPPVGLGFDLTFQLSGERTEVGFELEGQIRVFVGFKADTCLFDIRAGVEGFCGGRAWGDSGAECIMLMALGIHQTIAGFDEAAAAAVFGDGFDLRVMEGMDITPESEPVDPGPDAPEALRTAYETQLLAWNERDRVQVYAGIEAGASFATDRDAPADASGELVAGVRAESEYFARDGELVEEAAVRLFLRTGFTVEGFGMGVELTLDAENTRNAEVKVTGLASIPLQDCDVQLVAAIITRIGAGCVSAIRGLASQAETTEHAEPLGLLADTLDAANWGVADQVWDLSMESQEDVEQTSSLSLALEGKFGRQNERPTRSVKLSVSNQESAGTEGSSGFTVAYGRGTIINLL